MYTYTCIPTLLLAHLSSCLPANLPTCLPPAYVLTCLPAYPPIHTHLRTYVCACRRARKNVHVYLCTYANALLPTNLPTYYLLPHLLKIHTCERARAHRHAFSIVGTRN